MAITGKGQSRVTLRPPDTLLALRSADLRSAVFPGQIQCRPGRRSELRAGHVASGLWPDVGACVSPPGMARGSGDGFRYAEDP